MIATRPNLVLVPVGLPIDHFINSHNIPMDRKDHWRFKDNERSYDILAVQYGDYEPEIDTYDYKVKISGNKWKILKTIHNEKLVDFSQWNQIALFDDDVVLPCDALDAAFNFAEINGITAYQISVTPESESSYPILKNNPEWLWAETNFMEIMCPFFSKENLFKVIELINQYDANHGWGLDYIFNDYLKTNIGVLHFIAMYHPSRPQTGSSYTKRDAENEMNFLLTDFYPKLTPGWNLNRNEIIKIHTR
jgi:hypothetical protein